MTDLNTVLPKCDVFIDLPNFNDLTQPRVGIGVHYDASSSDAGALGWFRSKAFKLSYNRAYTDNGRRIRLTRDVRSRAWHFGTCRKDDARVRDANSAFYGLCITAGDGDVVTAPQYKAICEDAAIIARFEMWTPQEVEFWLTGHSEWAIFNRIDNPKHPELWGQTGRKHDPAGSNPAKPVLDMTRMRDDVFKMLDNRNLPMWSAWL